jgi:hypothetical protein
MRDPIRRNLLNQLTPFRCTINAENSNDFLTKGLQSKKYDITHRDGTVMDRIPTILMVGHEVHLMERMNKQLRHQSFAVVVAHNGVLGLQMAYDYQPHIITRREFLNLYRALPVLGASIIGMSDAGISVDTELSTQLDGFLLLPAGHNELLACINAWSHRS